MEQWQIEKIAEFLSNYVQIAGEPVKADKIQIRNALKFMVETGTPKEFIRRECLADTGIIIHDSLFAKVG